MGMTREEVQIRMGVDNAGIKSGLYESKAQFAKFKEDILHQSKEIKHLIHGFGAFGVAESIVEILRPATEWISDFFGKLAFGGFEAAEKLDHVTKATGRLTQELREMRKEREAIDKATKEITSKTDQEKLEQKINNADLVERQKILEKLERDAFKKLDTGANEKENAEFYLDYTKKRIANERALKDLADDRAKKEKERQKENEDAHKKEQEHIKKETDLEREKYYAEKDIERTKKNFQEGKLSEYRPGLEEIANSASIYSGEAQQLLDARADARENLLMYGNTPETQRRIAYADKLREPLEKAGLLSPQEKIADATRASEKHLDDIKRELKDLNSEK